MAYALAGSLLVYRFFSYNKKLRFDCGFWLSLLLITHNFSGVLTYGYSVVNRSILTFFASR